MSDSIRMRIGQIPLSDNYRQAVGPEDKYDLIGAHQFCVLVREGLREWHTLLDVGCGSLRGGRLFIPYLKSGNYKGIEPNFDLVQDAIREEIGIELLKLKGVDVVQGDIMSMTDQCALSWFDFTLAQSILSHCTQDEAHELIRIVADILKPSGKFLATFVKGSYNEPNPSWSRPIVFRTSSFFANLAKEHNLVYTELDYEHPCNQTWFRMERET